MNGKALGWTLVEQVESDGGRSENEPEMMILGLGKMDDMDEEPKAERNPGREAPRRFWNATLEN